MTELCVACGQRPRKPGSRKCGPCRYRAEDPEKAQLRRQRGRVQRREYKRRLRREAGCESMEVIRQRGAQKRAEREAERLRRMAENSPERKPWLQFSSVAERYRCRYQNDPAFSERERERAIVFRFTHPEITVKSNPGRHWRLAAERADGSITAEVVRELLRAARCYLCGTELNAENRSIDHKIALSLGGDHSARNLAPCCLSCNLRKAREEIRQGQERRCE